MSPGTLLRSCLIRAALAMAVLLAPWGAGIPGQMDARAAAEESVEQRDLAFSVANQAFWTFYETRGGEEALGQPISHPFQLDSRETQLFRHVMLQLRADGSVHAVDVREEVLRGARPPSGLPTGEAVRRLMIGETSGWSAPDLERNPFYAQYDPVSHRGPLRPEELPSSRLDGAFRAGRLGDPRFGVVVVRAAQPRNQLYLASVLDALGASHWYAFDGAPGAGPGQSVVVQPWDDMGRLGQWARSYPGTTWIIGSEPNVRGPFYTSPEDFAEFLFNAARTVREADPSAVLVGPNVLNWDVTCEQCPGYISGVEWSEAFVAAYRSRHGALPLNVWGLHTYDLDWTRLPMSNARLQIEQILAARGWLDTQGLSLPIWLTEFGVAWAFEGLQWTETSDGRTMVAPRGDYRVDAVERFLDEMLGWLTTEGAAHRVERWYLFGTDPPPEDWATLYGGIAVLEPRSLAPTGAGRHFRSWALVSSGAR